MSILAVNSIEPANPGSETYFLAKAWVNFNGTGVIDIRQDGNVASLTDNGVGDYTVTFSTSIIDADYSTVGGGQIDVSAANAQVINVGIRRIAGASVAGSCRINSTVSSTTGFDPTIVTLAIFR